VCADLRWCVVCTAILARGGVVVVVVAGYGCGNVVMFVCIACEFYHLSVVTASPFFLPLSLPLTLFQERELLDRLLGPAGDVDAVSVANLKKKFGL